MVNRPRMGRTGPVHVKRRAGRSACAGHFSTRRRRAREGVEDLRAFDRISSLI
jgi:hypothetical protein